jgi:cytochrome c oxidase cbb3-type subunit I/II
LKFFAAGTTFYMMSTFEGPLLSIKSVNGLAHATDWVIGHVHSGALGWNGLIVFGMLYWAVPKLCQTELAFKKWVNLHFWIATFGILLYIVSMWISGITQGVMAAQMEPSGLLAHPNYIELVTTIIPLHVIRALGGSLYLVGMAMCLVNIAVTMLRAGKPADVVIRAKPLPLAPLDRSGGWARFVESFSRVMTPMVVVAVSIGGVLEIVPMFLVEQKDSPSGAIQPYTPLEILGRNIYMREGCNNCHTQMVRPIVHETQRYGPYSQAEEYIYDHPHLWGSKRTGPDLWRVGQKYGEMWHWKHMINPRSLVPGSIMPAYPWLAENVLDTSSLSTQLWVLKALGVPYDPEEIERSWVSVRVQGSAVIQKLKEQGGQNIRPDSELIALIAYLQRLGTDGKELVKRQSVGLSDAVAPLHEGAKP